MNDSAWYVEIEGKKWRRGLTTGTCAAAAAKAALIALIQQTLPKSVEINTPAGLNLHLPVAECRIGPYGASCGVVKQAGDDPDITHGVRIIADVSWSGGGDVEIEGGEGVGRVTKPGLQVAVGEAAINPVPRAMIRQALKECLPAGRGIKVVIRVPQGEKLAARTLNSALGICGGISILGTTGFVEPMSEEAFKYALLPQIDVALAAGRETLVFTPGKIGQRIAGRYEIPAAAVVLTSNFIGFMLNEAARRGVRKILIFGHSGKIVKVAGGIFHTHSRMADGRMEIIAAHAAAMGAPAQVVETLLACVTTEAAVPILEAAGLRGVFQRLAGRASQRAEQFVHHRARIGTVMISLQGEIIGLDQNAREIGGEEGWQLK